MCVCVCKTRFEVESRDGYPWRGSRDGSCSGRGRCIMDILFHRATHRCNFDPGPRRGVVLCRAAPRRVDRVNGTLSTRTRVAHCSAFLTSSPNFRFKYSVVFQEREGERERIFSYILFSEIDRIYEEKIYIIILVRNWRSRLDSK